MGGTWTRTREPVVCAAAQPTELLLPHLFNTCYLMLKPTCPFLFAPRPNRKRVTCFCILLSVTGVSVMGTWLNSSRSLWTWRKNNMPLWISQNHCSTTRHVSTIVPLFLCVPFPATPEWTADLKVLGSIPCQQGRGVLLWFKSAVLKVCQTLLEQTPLIVENVFPPFIIENTFPT